MGIDEKIKNLPRKRLELFKNLVSVGVIFTILYAALVLMWKFRTNVLGFFKTQEFVYVCLMLLVLSVVWKILNGGKIGNQKKPNRKHKDISEKHDSVKTKVGSWRCPKCNTYVVGYQCPVCKYKVIR